MGNRIRMIFTSLFLGLALMVAASGPPAFAGSLSMKTTSRWEPGEDGRIRFHARITNRGDEAARDVRMEIGLGKYSEASPLIRVLSPEDSTDFQFSVPGTAEGTAGRFPLISRLRYKDTNLYEFSAISCTVLSWGGETARPLVTGRADGLSMGRNGHLNATIRNGHDQPVEIEAEIVLPDELSCPQPKRCFRMDPGSGEEIGFSLRNLTALAGSAYWVPIVIQYDLGGIHYSTVIPSKVTIRGDSGINIFGRAWVALAGIAVLIGLIVWIQLRKTTEVEKP